jgi:extracellular factor (EF) 3-hydroxypalmitic acid methyl ester biosynthesis protein
MASLQMTGLASAIERLLTFKNSQGMAARGTLLHMTRSQIVFEVYNPYSIVQLSEVLQDLTISRGGVAIYQGKAVVSSLVNTGLMLIVSATLVDRWSDLAQLLRFGDELGEEAQRFIADWEKTKKIRPGYQIAVGDLRSFLSQLSPWLDQVDMLGPNSVDDVPAAIIDQLEGSLMPKVVEIQQQFEKEAQLVDRSELATHRLFAQRDLLPLMMRAPFFHRSYTKPLGYAGDYMMVKMMVDGIREGPTTYSRIVNDFYLAIDLVKAHRNRLTIIENMIAELARKAAASKRKISILNIGCGPSIEIIRFIENSPLCEACHFHLVDFNEETLNFARAAIAETMRRTGRAPGFEFTQQSVHTLLKQSAATRRVAVRTYDFVYCAGLFDYLSDRICERLLALFCGWSKPGGTVLATNVHPDNPTRLIMEHVIEWHLYHRTMDELAALAPDKFERSAFDDETKMNVFVAVKIPE